jgi:hypothetical protein
MSNIGKELTDFYCNGFAGRRYDLEGSIIEAEGRDWIVIRPLDGRPVFIDFNNWNKIELIDSWTSNDQ